MIDLQITVPSLEIADRDEFVKAMTSAGYVVVPENITDHSHDGEAWPKRFYGSCDPGQFVHVHVREAGSPGAVFAVAFRDWLRAHPAEAARYAEHKRTLAASAETTTAYAESKEPWFAEVYPRVMAWAKSAGS